jgi:hypothetical protein
MQPSLTPASLVALIVLQLVNSVQLFLNTWGLGFTTTPTTQDIAENLDILISTTSSTSAPPSVSELACPGHLSTCLDSLLQCTRRSDVEIDYTNTWALAALVVVVIALTVLLFFLYLPRKVVPPVRRWGLVAACSSPVSSLSPVSEAADISFVTTPSTRRAALGL